MQNFSRATHVLIFKAGSVFPNNIKLLSQWKGKYLEPAINSWQALILTHYYTWLFGGEDLSERRCCMGTGMAALLLLGDSPPCVL